MFVEKRKLFFLEFKRKLLFLEFVRRLLLFLGRWFFLLVCRVFIFLVLFILFVYVLEFEDKEEIDKVLIGKLRFILIVRKDFVFVEFNYMSYIELVISGDVGKFIIEEEFFRLWFLFFKEF